MHQSKDVFMPEGEEAEAGAKFCLCGIPCYRVYLGEFDPSCRSSQMGRPSGLNKFAMTGYTSGGLHHTFTISGRCRDGVRHVLRLA